MTILKYLFLLIGVLFCGTISGQSISELEARYRKATKYRDKMLIKYDLAQAYMSKDLQKAARHAQDAVDIAYKMRDKDWQAKIYYLDGEIHVRRRDNARAEARFKSALSNAKDAGNKQIIINSADQLANLSYKDRDYKRAYEYSKESLSYLKKGGRSSSSSSSSTSSADRKKMVRLENQNVKLANEKYQAEREVIRLKEEIADLKGENVDFTSARRALEKQKVDLERERKKAEEVEERLAEVEEAKEAAEKRTKRRDKEIDKLSKDALKKELLLQEAENEKLEAERAKEKQNQLFLYGTIGAAFLILLTLLRLWANRRAKKKLEEKNKQIEKERERSDELLLNILPEPIAKELKENGKAKAQKYDSVSVLFTDFKNFSKISERLSPEALVAELDHCFKAFDYIISQYPGIEKIKTIGDAYMCASGLTDRKKMPNDLVRSALEMQEFLEDYKQDRIQKGLPFFEARIGVHTGPVVAGVVGFNKFAYDIWGDTVNIASRMESNCEPGKVNISESTYNQVRYKFACDYRGKIAAKNKGMIDMYYVEKAL